MMETLRCAALISAVPSEPSVPSPFLHAPCTRTHGRQLMQAGHLSSVCARLTLLPGMPRTATGPCLGRVVLITVHIYGDECDLHSSPLHSTATRRAHVDTVYCVDGDDETTAATAAFHMHEAQRLGRLSPAAALNTVPTDLWRAKRAVSRRAAASMA